MNKSSNLKALMGLGILLVSTNIFAVSDAAKIGGNLGAMDYCRDKIASSDDRGKYNLLKVKALGEYDDLNSENKVKALVFKSAAEKGDYLGDPLTKRRCDSLRKMLFLRYGD
ncbi:MAG: hypothetical protein GQ583_12675 [Methyloprofundus sp.]|nr:hypothetical protein [Methyloprofundus sp.]